MVYHFGAWSKAQTRAIGAALLSRMPQPINTSHGHGRAFTSTTNPSESQADSIPCTLVVSLSPSLFSYSPSQMRARLPRQPQLKIRMRCSMVQNTMRSWYQKKIILFNSESQTIRAHSSSTASSRASRRAPSIVQTKKGVCRTCLLFIH